MVELYSWTDALSVGWQELDEQHKVLFDILHELHDAINANAGATACNIILEQLVEHTRTHFLMEESLMRLLSYPDFDAHRVQHGNLLKQVAKVQARLEKYGFAVSFELLHFLKAWLVNHVLHKDQRFAAYALSRGVDAEWSPNVSSAMAGGEMACPL